jgi:HSP20 family protein
MSNFSIDLEKQLSKLGKDIQHLVERAIPVQQPADFHPRCDVIDGNDYVKIIADLPGMSKKQVSLTLKNGVVTISGNREFNLDEGEERVKGERPEGSFSRAFAIPEGGDESSIAATFKDGVLTVKILKKTGSDDAGGTSIPIK